MLTRASDHRPTEHPVEVWGAPKERERPVLDDQVGWFRSSGEVRRPWTRAVQRAWARRVLIECSWGQTPFPRWSCHHEANERAEPLPLESQHIRRQKIQLVPPP